MRYGIDGTFHPKLIRNDYTVGSLPSIDESVMLEPPAMSRKSWIETVNELKVQYSEIIDVIRDEINIYRPNKKLLVTGYNIYGQLGLGDTTTRTTFNDVGSLIDWDIVSAGFGCSLAIKTDGSLWSWGNNSNGQLGIDYYEFLASQSSPIQVGSTFGGTPTYDWADIAAGNTSCFALKTDGTLWAWGRGDQGQIGDGTTASKSTPIQIGSDTDWAKIFCRNKSVMAIKTDGSLWTWGYNNYGQLGLGDISNRSTPTMVGTGYSTGAVGGSSMAAIKTDGSLWSWGYNNIYQLGLGDNVNRSTPSAVGTSAAAVDINALYMIVLKATLGDGYSLHTVGSNYYGALGQGDTVNRTSLMQVGSSISWAKVTAGNNAWLGIKTDYSLWGCGANGDGRLGLGATSGVSAPTRVGAGSDWKNISMNYGHTLATYR
jgi:alpha-tubulin suppressor-like RCC1 family protein